MKKIIMLIAFAVILCGCKNSNLNKSEYTTSQKTEEQKASNEHIYGNNSIWRKC